MQQTTTRSPNTPDRTTPIGRGATSRPKHTAALVAAGVIATILLIWPAWANVYTDFLWFNSLGYGGLYSTILGTKVMLGIAVGLFAAGVAWFNFRMAVRLSPKPTLAAPVRSVNEQGVPIPDLAVIAALLPRLATPLALFIGAFSATLAWSGWDAFLRYRHQQPFGEVDPIFGRDIGFYFFTLPILDSTAGLGNARKIVESSDSPLEALIG